MTHSLGYTYANRTHMYN